MVIVDLEERLSDRLRDVVNRSAAEIDAEVVRDAPVPVESIQIADAGQKDAHRLNAAFELLILHRLEQHPHFRGRTVLLHVESVEGMIVLSGRLPSCYLKRLLHEAVGEMAGVVDVDNQVFVMRPNE